jgi:hypothetical protein
VTEPAVLSSWTIYFNPSDHPGRYVLRRFDIVQGQAEPVPASDASIHLSLQAARQHIPTHVDVCFPRDAHDDPAIVETWM